MSVIQAPQQTHDAYFAYDNLALNALAITGTTPASGYPIANLFNYFTFDGYKPDTSGASNVDVNLSAANACDYFAFYNSNLADNGGSIVLQYWNGAAWVDCFAPYSPTDNAPQLFIFAEVSSDQYRILIDSTPASIVSVVSFGKSLPVPYGLTTSFASPHNAQQYRNRTNESETGNFIGRSVRKEAVPFTVSTELLQYDWMRDEWRDFLRHLERRPCFFKWSNTTYTDESCLLLERRNNPDTDV